MNITSAQVSRGEHQVATGELSEQAGGHYARPSDWLGAPLSGLVDHIEQTHHDYLKRELRRVEHLADQIADQHGNYVPESIELAGEMKRLRVELEWHIWKEHADFFPLCRKLQSGRPAGGIGSQITALQRENGDADDLLRRMRRLEGEFAVAFEPLSESLGALELATRAYLRVENTILFPQALKDAARLGAKKTNQKKRERRRSFS